MDGPFLTEGGVGGNDVGDDGEDAESVDKVGRDEDGEDGVGAGSSSELSCSSSYSCGSAVQSDDTKSR